MGKRIKLCAMGAAIIAAAVVAFAAVRPLNKDEPENLALMRGVKVYCDSVETEELSAKKAVDGDDTTPSSRWSSENNWESAAHYIELEFPEEISVSFVVLKWERRNATVYKLEGSRDGESWETLAAFDKAPELKRQEIPLPESTELRFLKLSIEAVSENEEDYSNLYQNVSLYEFEVYKYKPASYYVEAPSIKTRADGSRFLDMPKAPSGYELTYLGTDYEQVIGMDGEIYDTIQDKEVVVGFKLENKKNKEDTEDTDELSFMVEVPAWESENARGDRDVISENAAPAVIPAIAEWRGDTGEFTPAKSCVIIDDDKLMQTAARFAQAYSEIMEEELTIKLGNAKDAAGGFYLGCEDTSETAGLGEEGYICDISDTCVIKGCNAKGVYWGTITILQILKTNEGRLPNGKIRDYPKYEVRGFGIDVARKPVSMDELYQIVKNMSWYKMNDLSIHLNDNEILSTSGLTGSFEEALTAYSAFRIDTSVTNEDGEKLTARDYAYTAEEFAAFITTAKAYGVRIVPEFDTPAHSLAITKLFPEYALDTDNEAADQLDLSNKEATELVKNIWRELLNGEDGSTAAFEGAEIVNIGMDEYYGKGEAYRAYMNELIELVRNEGGVETVRIWGSLGNMDGTLMPPAGNLQMNIWSDVWAQPLEMYEKGYSLINTQNNHLYIIPGGGYDYLDKEELYKNWEPNKFYDGSNIEIVPSYSSKMLGASYMLWNDMCGGLDAGICEADLFRRFFEPLGIISGRLWGGLDIAETYDKEDYEEYERLFESLGFAPESNPCALKEWEGDTLKLTGEDEVISLGGGEDYVNTGYTGGNGNGVGIGGSYSVSFDVYRDSTAGEDNKEEQILFETDTAYAASAFKAVQTGSGNVGFSREGRDYSFDYELPCNEWVSLTIRGEQDKTSLYVNGELIDTLGDSEPFGEYATFVFPLGRIGSRTDSFCGMIRNIVVTVR